MRKFEKSEIDLLYNQLRADEEVLWKGKPKLVPNLTVLTTLILSFIISVILTILAFVNESIESWFLFSLIALDIGVIYYIINYSINHYNNINHIFYAITNSRLVIFDSKNERIMLYKRYNMVRILRVKRTVFNTASIIFDVDFTQNKMKEIGFVNIDKADDVLSIINQQLHHMRT